MANNKMNPKIRYDLVPQYGMEEVCKVLTSKLEKYQINEWKHGISWTQVLSNLKQHLCQFELGNDFTEEGLYHIAEVAMNALILTEYMHIYPQGDDRVLNSISVPRIALDIDDVCLNFTQAFEEKFQIKLNPYWDGTYNMSKYLDTLKTEKDFWINLKPLNIPTFEPTCYITSRSIPIEWTKECLEKNGFPCAPVYCVPWNESKVQLLKQHQIDILIDDKPLNYKEATDAGIFCYLMDAPHNRFLKCGHRRIYSLNLQL